MYFLLSLNFPFRHESGTKPTSKHYHNITFKTLTNANAAWINANQMQIVQTPKDRITAHVTLDIVEMDSTVQVQHA